MEQIVKDMFGHKLVEGDSICFTLSMRKDQKPIVKARIGEFICNHSKNWIVIDEYVETDTVRWARDENKLIQKVSADRVVKCY